MSKIPALAFLTCMSLAQGDLDMATLVVLKCRMVQAAFWDQLQVTVIFSDFIDSPTTHFLFSVKNSFADYSDLSSFHGLPWSRG